MVVECAVEMEVAAACESLEAVFVPDFHGVAEDRIVAQLDRERAKGERDLEEFFTEGDRAVLAHDAFGAGVKKRGDFVGVLDVADGVGVAAESFVRGLAGGAVDAQVVGGGDPMGKGGVEFAQAVSGIAVEAQGQLEVALDGLNEPLDFAFAPGVVGLGVQEADAEVGANDFCVVVDEGFALVGVEFDRQAAPQHGLLEAVEESGGVGARVVASKDDEPTVVVNNEAEVGGDDFAVVSTESRTAGEIDHPQIVGRGGFEGFGRTVVEPSGLEAAGVEAEPSVEKFLVLQVVLSMDLHPLAGSWELLPCVFSQRKPHRNTHMEPCETY